MAIFSSPARRFKATAYDGEKTVYANTINSDMKRHKHSIAFLDFHRKIKETAQKKNVVVIVKETSIRN